MSQPELLDRLREQTPGAPDGLRTRVALVAAAAPPPRTRRPRRRVLVGVVAFGLLAVAATAATLVELGGSNAPTVRALPYPVKRAGGLPFSPTTASGAAAAPALAPAKAAAVLPATALPAPSPTRAQRYRSTLRLRVATGIEVAAAARRALEIVQGLGGYPTTIEMTTKSATGTASLTLAVPRLRVGTAITRLSTLGTVVEEHVSVSDLQSGINATSRTIARLEGQLTVAEHAASTAKTRALAAALTVQIERLQRERAASQRSSSDASVTVVIATVAAKRAPTPHVSRSGPFHDLGVAARDVGIGAVYALAFGVPLALLVAASWFVAARLRRRREERLLSRS